MGLSKYLVTFKKTKLNVRSGTFLAQVNLAQAISILNCKCLTVGVLGLFNPDQNFGVGRDSMTTMPEHKPTFRITYVRPCVFMGE